MIGFRAVEIQAGINQSLGVCEQVISQDVLFEPLREPAV